MSEKSISEQIAENLRTRGFVPVPVQVLNDESAPVRYFTGDFDAFVEAAQALGSKAIFIEPLYLEDEEFYYDADVEEDEEDYDDCDCDCEDCDCDDDCDCEHHDESEEAQEEVAEADGSEEGEDDETAGVWLDPEDLDGMDLTLLDPELDQYLERIGEECGVRLSLPGPDRVEVEIFTDWYDRFAELVDAAVEEIETDPAAALEKIKSNG